MKWLFKGHGLVMELMSGWLLGLMILEVFSNLGDYMILSLEDGFKHDHNLTAG